MKIFVQIVFFVFLLSGYTYPQKPGNEVNNKDGNYVYALSAANHFLEAWRWRREEEEINLLSDSLKKKLSQEQLDDYLSGISNPHHEAYEISAGTWLSDRRISFPVQLFFAMTSDMNGLEQPEGSTIIMEMEDNNQWFVDQLP